MQQAVVTGTVWSTKRIEGMPPGALLKVRTAGGDDLVAFDVLGSGVGEEVLIT
ncbi:EutN/CcmL family microcompartment protein, partial [Gordonia sp. (in: high G+C Gram-positive bacteria)]